MSRAFGLLFACLFVGACSGNSTGVGTSSSSNEPTAELAGAWKGTWTSKTGVSGSMSVTIQQSGSTVDGELHFSGSPCFANGHFAGTITGHDFSGSVTAGAIRVDMSGAVTGNAYDGTYTAVSAGACTGDTGTFTATR